MELAVSTYSLARWRHNGASLEDCLDWIAAQGASAVEFVGLDQPAEGDALARAGQLRQRCEQLGLKVAGYCVGAELLVEPAEQAKVVEQLKAEVDIAAALGAPSMRHDVTRGPGDQAMTLEQVIERVAPALRDVADHAAGQGVISTLENHGFYLQTAERIDTLIKTVDHPNYRLTIDLGNFLCLSDDPLEATRRLARWVVLVHAKDFHVRPADRVPPGAEARGDEPALGSGWFATPPGHALRGAVTGHGTLDLPAQLKTLVDAGYDGPLSLEFEGIEDPRQAVRLGLAYLQQQIDQLTASQSASNA